MDGGNAISTGRASTLTRCLVTPMQPIPPKCRCRARRMRRGSFSFPPDRSLPAYSQDMHSQGMFRHPGLGFFLSSAFLVFLALAWIAPQQSVAQDDPDRQPAAADAAKDPEEKPASDPKEPELPAEGNPAPAGEAEQPAEGQAEGQRRVGKLITVAAPITSSVTLRVIRIAKGVIADAKQKGEWPVLIFKIDPGLCAYGAALDLATEITMLDGATTVAYIPTGPDGEPVTLRGHAVLVAMACEQIAMSKTSKIGEAGGDEKHISPVHRSGYAEIADLRDTVPVDLALGMLDPAVEVYQVQTVTHWEFVLGNRLPEIEKQKTVVVKRPPLIRAGEAGLFTGQQAHDLGFVRYLVSTPADLARDLGLPPEALDEDPSVDGGWRPVRVALRGEITPNIAAQAQNLIEEEISRRDVNFICIEIDSPGGSISSTLSLASYIAGLDRSRRRTVAYIPNEARGEAAFVALACDNIVMKPEAVLGGTANIEADEIPATVTTIEGLAERKGRKFSLWAAIIDPNLTVYRYTRKSDGHVEYFSELELASEPDANAWQKGEAVTEPDESLEVDGSQAQQLGMVSEVVDTFQQLKAIYGIDQNMREVEPRWSDLLLKALRNPELAFLLLMIGGSAFYAELQSPGIGAGGFIAAVCFLLFFWGQYLGGTAGWLEILLFILGIGCIFFEVLVLPGFGVFGFGGGVLVLMSFVLAMQNFDGIPTDPQQLNELRRSLTVIVGAGVCSTLGIFFLRRYLPHAPLLRHVILNPLDDTERGDLARSESVADYSALVGRCGTTVTQLTPAGKALIENRLIDVISEDELIERGAGVEVIRALGNRVVVRRIG